MRSIRAFCLLILLVILAGDATGQDGSRLRRGFERLDADGNSRLSKTELDAAPRLGSRLEGADRDGDGDGALRWISTDPTGCSSFFTYPAAAGHDSVR